MTEAVLQVQMLGGFSLRLDGEPVPSIPARPSSLLAFLIINRDREHTRDLLAGRFWSDTSDDKARRRLTQALWHIRRATRDQGITLVSSTSNTVRFNPDVEVALDVDIFETRLDDHERRARLAPAQTSSVDLSAIVDSYRGELLAGYYEEWIDEDRQRLRHRYRDGLRRLIASTMKVGDYEAALGHAQAMVNEEPLDEEAQRELLRLYGLNGQVSAAQRHYKRLVRQFDQQLDVELSPETTDLMERILDGAAAAPVAIDEDATSLPFVGRPAERSLVLNRVNELAAGRGGFVLIEGEPGIGKSRLVAELAAGADWRGVNVLIGHHNDTSALTPYEGLKEALSRAVTGIRGDHLRESVEPVWLAAAEAVLPDLAEGRRAAGRRRDHPDDEPWTTTEALARIVLAQGRPKPTVLILEDLHRCDEDTIAVLVQLSSRLVDTPVLVCVTYDLHEAQRSPAIWSGLSSIEAAPATVRVPLGPLGADEVHDLIVAELGPGRLPAATIDQLVSTTGGNPYVVLELLRGPIDLLVETDPVDDDLDDEVFAVGRAGAGAPTSAASRMEERLRPWMTEVVLRRVDTTSDTVRRVLEAVAVFGVPVRAQQLAPAVDLEMGATIEGLQDAIALGFLAETERGCDFVQAQTRRVVYDAMAAEQRILLHGRIADAQTLAEDRLNVEQIAHHAWQAGQWQRAHQYHSLAADSAVALNAHQTAAEHFAKADQAAQSAGLSDPDRTDDLFQHERVLDVLGRRDDQATILGRIRPMASTDPGVELRLSQRQAWLHLNTGGAAEAERVALSAIDRARSGGHNAGELLTVVGMAAVQRGEMAEAVGPLEEAIVELQAGGHSPVQAQLTLGRTHGELQDYDAAHRHLEAAFAEAKEAADARGQVEALGHMATIWVAQGVESRAESAFGEALELARDIGYREGEARNLLNLAVFSMVNHRFGRAVGLLGDAEGVFASLGNTRGQAFVQANSALVRHWIFGDEATARRQAEAAAVEFRRIGDARTEAACLTTLAAIDLRAGRRRQARTRFVQALDQAGAVDDPGVEVLARVGLAMVELDLDHHGDALAHVLAAQELRESHGLDDFRGLITVLEARAVLAQGERARADRLADRVIQVNHPRAEFAHLAAWWCSEVLVTLGRLDDAAEQVALAHRLLTANLDGAPEELARRAWEVPEHEALLLARERFFVDVVPWEVPAADVPTGRPLQPADFVEIAWTRSHPDDWSTATAAERRRERVLRLTTEAVEQGGVARQIDLAEVLAVSERTIKRDLAQLRSEGHRPATRRDGGEIS